MSAQAASAAPERETELYRTAVAATPGAELKGASMPYSSVNGNMNSFLDKKGTCAIRLGEVEREAFMQEFATVLYAHETGVVMKEYVAAPPSLLADANRLAGWLGKSLSYAKTLKPKATTRKKSAA
jgi:TfoX/Sxy family transcriptional regulator of competence genes